MAQDSKINLVPLIRLHCPGEFLRIGSSQTTVNGLSEENQKTQARSERLSKWHQVAALPSFAGGAGGSARSGRVRQEKELLEGFKQLLNGLQKRGGHARSRSPSPSPSQPRSLVPPQDGLPKAKGEEKGEIRKKESHSLLRPRARRRRDKCRGKKMDYLLN